MAVNASSFPAPSAATIATAVAAAVPTTAGITSIVQANAASPYGGTITNLGFVSGNGVNTVTFSSLTGYKKLVLFWQGIDSTGSSSFRIRLNSDSGNNYAYTGVEFQNTSNNRNVGVRQTSIYLGGMGTGANNCDGSGMLELFDTNSGAYKTGTNFATSYNGFSAYAYDWRVLWASTAAISSITISNDSANFTTTGTGGFYLKGLA